MKLLLQEIRRNPLLWLLVFVPVALATEKLNHEAHTLHFVLSVLAILPLAVLLSHATESVAAKTGDSVGGLLNATRGTLSFAFAGIRSRSLVFAQHASRIVRRRGRGTRSGVADRSGTCYTGGCYGFCRIDKRSVCRIRSVRGDRLWNEPCLRWVHRCSLGGRSCRNGGCIFRRAQKSSRFERQHCTWQRRADCALRCSGSGTSQLFDWPHADGFEFLAWSSRNDSLRNAHRVSGDHVWPLRLVRRRARDLGLSDIRHGAVSFAAGRNHMNG